MTIETISPYFPSLSDQYPEEQIVEVNITLRFNDSDLLSYDYIFNYYFNLNYSFVLKATNQSILELKAYSLFHVTMIHELKPETSAIVIDTNTLSFISSLPYSKFDEEKILKFISTISSKVFFNQDLFGGRVQMPDPPPGLTYSNTTLEFYTDHIDFWYLYPENK